MQWIKGRRKSVSLDQSGKASPGFELTTENAWHLLGVKDDGDGGKREFQFRKIHERRHRT